MFTCTIVTVKRKYLLHFKVLFNIKCETKKNTTIDISANLLLLTMDIRYVLTITIQHQMLNKELRFPGQLLLLTIVCPKSELMVSLHLNKKSKKIPH